MNIEIFKLEKIRDRLYSLTFENDYVLAMHFLRYQEYYESHNPKFKGNTFSMMDYMEWYSTHFKKTLEFTYPADWSGFNFPTKLIKEQKEKGMPDFNRYDAFMNCVHDMIVAGGDEDSYLIGSRIDCKATMDHEIAHGLYYLEPKYKTAMDTITSLMPSATKELIFDYLRKDGYCEQVLHDELQAYMATGWDDVVFQNLIDPHQPSFVDVYKHYAPSKS